jgi:hypothetical protein
MTYVPFAALYPEVARQTVRASHAPGAPPVVWLEHYCPNPACDCKRVRLIAVDGNTGDVLANINHSFDPPVGDWEGIPQTHLEPLAEQTPLAPALVDLFVGRVLTSDYDARLRRHYTMCREFAVRHKVDPDLDDIEFVEAVMTIARRLSKRAAKASVGRNDPCPCESGKKYKRCCGQRR